MTAKTNATISVIADQLMILPLTMMVLNSDIKEFITKVQTLLNSYYANKRENYVREILLQTLFKSYKLCNDNEFVVYNNCKEQDHKDGTAVITSDLLLDIALKKYQKKNPGQKNNRT